MIAATSAFASEHAALAVAALCAALAVVAACFVAWPVWRSRTAAPLAHALLTGALVLFTVGVGLGSYLLVGTPELAERALETPEAGGVPGLIAELSRRIRDRPNDVAGWTLLGRGYLTLNDPQQAAVAFLHASEIAPPQQKPQLLSSYGEALTLAAGTVTPEAEAAFRSVLAQSPKDYAARFYLGEAYAERRDPARALAQWQSLLADTPTDAPWRAGLIDRMAVLRSQSGAAPDVRAMVAGLAARLRSQPGDLSGWERLVRAYAVLGESSSARSALANARAALLGRPRDLAVLEAEARSLDLEK
ncbi:MAG: tetratricopeptide repeat protein [Rhizomicrobium sp.]